MKGYTNMFVLATLSIPLTFAQSIGIGTNNPHTSAALDIHDTSRGILIPRLTTQQRDAIPNPAHTLMIFNIDSFCIEVYDTATQMWYTISCPRYCLPPQCIPSILGPSFACAGDTILYQAAGCPDPSYLYLWQVPPSWQMLAGQGTPQITVVPDTTDGPLSLTLCNLCGCSYGVAQQAIQADSCQPFCIAIGGSQNDEGYDLTVLPDGKIAIVGATNSFGAGGYDTYILLTQPNGNLIWSKTYGSTSDDYYATSGRSVIYYSSKLFFGGEFFAHGDGMLVAVDTSGNILWGRRISAYAHTSIVRPFRDDTLIVAGYAWTYGLFLVDTSGNVLAGYTFPASCGSTPMAPTDLVSLPSGGFMGTIHGRCPNTYKDWITYLGSDFQLKWARRYDGVAWGDPSHRKITPWDSTSACAALGYALVCIDTAGTPWLEVNFTGIALLSGIAITPWRTIVVAGWTTSNVQFGGPSDGFLAELDSTGTVLRAIVLGGPGEDRLYSMQALPNGDLILTGWTTSFGNGQRDVWLVRLDPTWTLPCQNCNVSTISISPSYGIASSVHTFTRTTLSGVVPDGIPGTGGAVAYCQ